MVRLCSLAFILAAGSVASAAPRPVQECPGGNCPNAAPAPSRIVYTLPPVTAATAPAPTFEAIAAPVTAPVTAPAAVPEVLVMNGVRYRREGTSPAPVEAPRPAVVATAPASCPCPQAAQVVHVVPVQAAPVIAWQAPEVQAVGFPASPCGSATGPARGFGICGASSGEAPVRRGIVRGFVARLFGCGG